MHPDLGHPHQQVRRRSVAPHPTALLPRLHDTILGPLLGAAMVQLVELRVEAVLYG